MKGKFGLALQIVVSCLMALNALAADIADEQSAEAPGLSADKLSGGKHGVQRWVRLENATVEVIEMLYPPGSESALHTHAHPCRIIYAFTAGELELVSAEGQSQRIGLQPGQTVFRMLDGPETHTVHNIGATAIRILEVELKDALRCRQP